VWWRVLREGYFSALPPKSCGGRIWALFAEKFIATCCRAGGSDADVVATATALTAASVVDAYRRFVAGYMGAAGSAG